MKRTFIAVKILPGDEMKEIYDLFREDLHQEKIKWVDPGSLHLTLCFLGDTREELIPGLKQVIEDTVSTFPHIKLTFQGCGVFKNFRDPRVIWIGIKRNDLFINLKKQLDEAIEPFGFLPEKREFRPHLTLARIKWIRDKSVLEDLIMEHKDSFIQESEIKEVIFYESILKPQGPEYLPLQKAILRG